MQEAAVSHWDVADGGSVVDMGLQMSNDTHLHPSSPSYEMRQPSRHDSCGKMISTC